MIGQNGWENDFHWLFTTVFYQQIENSERANQIHGFTIDHGKFILIIIIIDHFPLGLFRANETNNTQINSTHSKSQPAGGRSIIIVGYVQGQLRS